MSFIPFDTCREILLRLPAEFLLRFRAVCKRWRDMIDDPCFVKTHTENQQSTNSIIIRNSVGSPFHPLYYFKLDDLDFTNAPQTIPVIPVALSRSGLSRLHSFPLTACNGLMLFAPGYRKVDRNRIPRKLIGTWEIWNPLTSEQIKLPDPSINLDFIGVGFGYDRVADDYRVVVIDSTRQTHLYSFKMDSWRKVGVCPFDLWRRDIKHGVFLNGASHWVSLYDKVIIAFDFATVNYRQLTLPGLKKTLPGSMRLEALGGCLFLSYIGAEMVNYMGIETYKFHFDVWVMNDYGAEDSWIKLLSLKDKPDFYFYSRRNTRLVAYMKNKRRLLMQHQNCFIWFDAGNNSIKTVDIHGFSGFSDISAQICSGSLLRLHDTCGRVASKIRTRGTVVNAYNKLTFCVRDYEKGAHIDARTSHDDCYNLDSNWYTYPCQRRGIHMPSSYPDGDYSVPVDICREIFLRLPAKSLIRFRAVCKAFRAIIDEPCFVRAHTNNQQSSNTILIRNSSGSPFCPFYSFDLDALYCTDGVQKIPTTPFNFTHSRFSRQSASVCNGLVLVSNEKLDLWNPLTNECLKLPRNGFFNSVMTTGLGYDYATDDYKVVVVGRCRRRERGEYEYRTHVYSLRSDTWKRIGNFPLDNHHGLILPGVYLSGVLHWTSWSMHKIITLDLGTESYSQLQWPPIRQRNLIANDHKVVEVLGGCLVLTDYGFTYDDTNNGMDVWVMKDYGAEDSWTKVYCIHQRYTYHSPIGSCRPVAFTKNKTQIFVQAGGDFFLFDVGSDSKSKRISIHGLGKSSYANVFSGSIFRLHDNCGVRGSGSGSTSLTAPRPIRLIKRRRDISAAPRRTRLMKRRRDLSDTELHFCVMPAHSLHSYRPHSTWCGWSSEDED